MRRKRTHQPGVPPGRQHLRHWQQVCQYIEAQPYRSIRFPFPSEPPVTARLLKRMARFRLITHREDCSWRLSAKWKAMLHRLAQGASDEDASPASVEIAGAPFIVAQCVDTMNVNLLAEEVPANLVALCEHYKALAQAANKSVATPWLFAGAPLSMLKSGKGTGEQGGVSWGFILRNEMAEVDIRKVPVSGIVASVRLSSECLWTNGPRAALDLMRSALQTMWTDRQAFREVRFCLSQIHLCADVAHFVLSPELVPRVRTHAINRTLYAPSDDEADGGDFDPDDEDPSDWDLYEGSEPDVFDLIDPEDFSADEDDEDDDEEDQGDDEAGEWADEGGMVHLRGQRVHGLRFAPGGALSAVWYDKVLEGRRRAKPWMRAIHEAGGWGKGMVLTRIEARFRREVLRELGAQWAVKPAPRWFDDPWLALDHLQDLWGFFAGLPPEADHAPDANQRGWLALTIPQEDTNRSRWPLDPVWLLVQRVTFSDTPPLPLTRIKQVAPDLDQIDAEIRGLLKTRAMLRGVYLHGSVSLTDEVVDFDERMLRWDEERGLDFNEEVRERARMAGKPLPLVAAGELPRSMKHKR